MNLPSKWSSGQFHQLVRNIFVSKQGSTVILLALLFLIPALVLSFFVIDSKFLRIKKSIADDVVVAAGLGALASSMEAEMAYGEYSLDKAIAEKTFKDHLQQGLMLDDNFLPMPGSMAAGEVVIESFVIYNHEEIVPGLTCPNGVPITHTTIHVVLSFPAKRSALVGLFGEEILIRIHRDVDNYYILKEGLNE